MNCKGIIYSLGVGLGAAVDVGLAVGAVASLPQAMLRVNTRTNIRSARL